VRSNYSAIARRCFSVGITGILLCLIILTVSAVEVESTGALKSLNLIPVYGIIALLSLLLVIGYCCLAKEKETGFLLLFISVFVVNLGYFALSISKTLDEAMLANRIAYLGSVMLPLCMLMIVRNACRRPYTNGQMIVLLCISIGTFLVAASGGYLNWYYRSVSLVFINGIATLHKEYGPLHWLYYAYLLLYFSLMVGTTVSSARKKQLQSHKHAVLLLCLVSWNLVIWLLEQMISWDFEFLSVSYILTELLLLFFYDILREYTKLTQQPALQPTTVMAEQEAEKGKSPQLSVEKMGEILAQWPGGCTLTARELEVLKLILEDRRRKDIADELFVSENTIKKHTAHIFAKLEVSNRAELMELFSAYS